MEHEKMSARRAKKFWQNGMAILIAILFLALFATPALAGVGSAGYKSAPPAGTQVDSSFRLTGNAMIDSTYKNVAVLTTDTPSRCGMLVSSNKLDLNAPFKTTAYLYIGHADGKTGPVADGLTFFLHNDSRGMSAAGDNGAGLCVYGPSYIKNSMIIEFDTYYNGDAMWSSTDPSNSACYAHNSILFPKAARVNPVDHLNTLLFNASSSWQKFTVQWQPQKSGSILGGTLTYYFDGTGRTSSYTISNVNSVFGGTSVWWGYSGATGSNSSVNAVAFVEMPVCNYTVSFVTNGGAPVPASQTVPSGGKVTKPADPVKSGYTFAGWYANANFTGNPWNFTTDTVNSDITLYAQWVPCSVNVTYNPNGGAGNVVTDTAVLNSSYTIKSQNYTKSGMDFNGWNTKADGTGVAYTVGQTVTVSADLTLYAQWKTMNVTVTYNPNGGTGSVATDTVTANSSYTIKNQNYTRPGMDFNGWNTKSDGTGVSYAPGQTVTVSADLTLYAQWKTANVTVTYNPNGGTGNVATDTVAVNSSYTIKSQNYTKTGMTFNGWNTKADGTGVAYTVGQTVTVTADLTLYAQWQAENPTVKTGDANDVTDNQATINNNTYTGVTCTVTAVGVQYNTSSSVAGATTVYSATKGSPFNVPLTGLQPNTTYYYRAVLVTSCGTYYGEIKTFKTAQQTVTCPTVTYDPNGGTGSQVTENVALNSSYTIKSQNYTRTGMTFTGWNTKADGTGVSYTVGQTITMTGSLTLYAQWTVVCTTTVTYDPNGGTGSQVTDNANLNSSYTIKSQNYTKTGMVFNGWNTNANGSGTAYTVGQTVTLTSSLTLYAQWKAEAGNITVVTGDPTNITSGGATINNNTYTNVNCTITKVGVQYSTNANLSSPTSVYGTNGSPFSVGLTGLQPSTTYYYRAVVASSCGNSFGAIKSFTTPSGTVPTVTVAYNPNGGVGQSVTENTPANSNYTVKSQGYTKAGMTFTGWNTKPDGTGVAYGVGQTIQLTGSITLYAQWCASCGDVVVTTGSVSMNGTNKFTVNGNSYSGNVGTVSSVGVQYSTDPNMVNGITSVGGTVITSPFNSVQITVTPGAAYYFRAYIVTSGGTFYGNIVGTWI